MLSVYLVSRRELSVYLHPCCSISIVVSGSISFLQLSPDLFQLWRLNPKFLNNTRFHTRDLLFFNRVPKVGSETLIALMYRLSEKNNFQVERAPFSKPVGVFWTAERQKQEAKRIFDLQEEPAFAYVEHMNFMNFRPFHHPQPIYINLV